MFNLLRPGSKADAIPVIPLVPIDYDKNIEEVVLAEFNNPLMSDSSLRHLHQLLQERAFTPGGRDFQFHAPGQEGSVVNLYSRRGGQAHEAILIRVERHDRFTIEMGQGTKAVVAFPGSGKRGAALRVYNTVETASPAYQTALEKGRTSKPYNLDNRSVATIWFDAPAGDLRVFGETIVLSKEEAASRYNHAREHYAGTCRKCGVAFTQG